MFSLTLFIDRSPLIPAVAGGSAQRCLEDFAIAWQSPADDPNVTPVLFQGRGWGRYTPVNPVN